MCRFLNVTNLKKSELGYSHIPMKASVLVIYALLSFTLQHPLKAQNGKDSLLIKESRLNADSLMKPIPKTDSLSGKANMMVDSLRAIELDDSLKVWEKPFNKLDSLSGAIYEFKDSLNLNNPVSDSLKKILPPDNLNEHLPKELQGPKGLDEMAKEKINHIEEVKEAGGLKAEANQEIDKYKTEVKEVGEMKDPDKAAERIEKEAENQKPVKELEQEIAKSKQPMEGYKDQAEKYQDQAYAKEQAKQKVVSAAKDHFSHHADKLKAAQELMVKYKKKYNGVTSLKDLPKGGQNPVKGKPLKERLNFGGNFQLHQGNPISIDISPLASYKITGKISLGIGGTYRYATPIKTKMGNLVAEGVYGYRGFAEYHFFKSFYAHAEYESMYKRRDGEALVARKENWVSGCLLGIGRHYKLSNKLKGNISLLYNVLHSEDSPYQKPLVFRFGVLL